MTTAPLGNEAPPSPLCKQYSRCFDGRWQCIPLRGATFVDQFTVKVLVMQLLLRAIGAAAPAIDNAAAASTVGGAAAPAIDNAAAASTVGGAAASTVGGAAA